MPTLNVFAGGFSFDEIDIHKFWKLTYYQSCSHFAGVANGMF